MPVDTMLMKGSDEKLDHVSDEAAHPQSPDLEEFLADSAEEKRLVRKLDRRILPITCLLYLFACSCAPLRCSLTSDAPNAGPNLQLWTGRT